MQPPGSLHAPTSTSRSDQLVCTCCLHSTASRHHKRCTPQDPITFLSLCSGSCACAHMHATTHVRACTRSMLHATHAPHAPGAPGAPGTTRTRRTRCTRHHTHQVHQALLYNRALRLNALHALARVLRQHLCKHLAARGLTRLQVLQLRAPA